MDKSPRLHKFNAGGFMCRRENGVKNIGVDRRINKVSHIASVSDHFFKRTFFGMSIAVFRCRWVGLWMAIEVWRDNSLRVFFAGFLFFRRLFLSDSWRLIAYSICSCTIAEEKSRRCFKA